MADSKEQTTTKKVLKFVFLPGFDQSIKQMSFLKPMFMRMLGEVFEKAGLIRRNHPAVNYGLPGVEDTSFVEVMSEALFTLKRAEKRNYYQLGIYGSVCLMIASVIATLVSIAMGISTTILSVASAQLFNHPTDVDMGMAGVPAAPDPATVGAFNVQTAQYLADGSGRQDWGIILLDKLFREGLKGEGYGGYLQRSFGSLMEVFNSAILLIAGIMIFWLIISIVIDTARTGEIGGNRHNMVWAPIRIIFALCLLIPLGTTGFSAGQLGVIKFAEWGSNLGTRAWSTYVSNAISGTIISGTEIQNFSGMVSGINKIWMCRVAANSTIKDMGLFQAGNEFFNQIRPIFKLGQTKYDPNLRSYVYTFDFSNHRGDSCGTITFPGKLRDTGAELLTDDSLMNVPTYIKTYTEAVKEAFVLPIISNYDAESSVNTLIGLVAPGFFNFDDGTLMKPSRKFACAIASAVIDHEKLADMDECSDWSEGSCGEGEDDDPLPDKSCYLDAFNAYKTSIQSGISTANENLADDPASITYSAEKEGWPSMGWWYHDLYKLNSLVRSAGTSPITIQEGSINRSSVADVVNEVNNAYQLWWEKMVKESPEFSSVGNTGDMNAGAEAVAPMTNKVRMPAGSSGNEIDLSAAFAKSPQPSAASFIAGGPMGILKGLGTFARNVVFDTVQNIFMWPLLLLPGRMVAALQGDEYPIVKISSVGAAMLQTGEDIFLAQQLVFILGAIVSMIGSILSIVPAWAVDLGGFYDFAQALVEGPVGKMLLGIGKTLIVSSVIPLYYVPFVPFVKVSFAVLTWVLGVFEAVVMTPVLALSFINTNGEGIGGQKFWPYLLRLLFYPITIVIAFVGSILVLNSFVIFFNYGFMKAVASATSLTAAHSIFETSLKGASICVIYGTGIYTIINTSFKLLETIPKAFADAIGGGGGFSTVASGDLSGGLGAVGSAAGGAMEAGTPKPSKQENRPGMPDGPGGPSTSDGGASGGGGTPAQGGGSNISSGGTSSRSNDANIPSGSSNDASGRSNTTNTPSGSSGGTTSKGNFRPDAKQRARETMRNILGGDNSGKNAADEAKKRKDEMKDAFSDVLSSISKDK